jgi:tetrapyrrole methylase family protein / MazG family protein
VTDPRIVIAGLGPAGPEYVTQAVSAAIARAEHRYIRTTRHPSASVVGEAIGFDELYETADTFDDVYATIVERLVAAAQQHDEILYAVPGSPWVLERTVRLLIADDRVVTDVLPSLSFLDLAYAALEIDPVEAGVRLIDGHRFAEAAAGETGPLLVAHCHANWVLSDIKLAVEDGDGEVVILQRLGCADQQIITTSWAELDRTVEADHLTSIYIPRLAAPVGHELVRFHAIVRQLREECPWDRKQTHQSLAKYAIEETYELVEAIGQLGDDGAGDEHLEEELGDVLLQVVLNAAIAEQQGRFNLADVARTISDKMVRRHPHVFGDTTVAGADEVVTNWAAIKATEKGHAPEGIFDGLVGSLPALTYASEMSKKAAKVGFDWSDPRGTLGKVAEELAEVDEAWDDPIHLHEELGDLLFAVANVARHRGIDPEVALRQASAKFQRRCEAMYALAGERSIDTHTCGEAILDELWEMVKTTERS